MPLSLPFFKFNVTDWLTSHCVTLFTNQQRGVYIMLLAHQWASATCTLDDNPKRLMQLTQWTGSDEEFLGVLDCFKPAKRIPGRRMNLRLYREWQDACTRITRFSEGGAKGAQARWARKPSTAAPTNGIATWTSYAHAYEMRYHVPPVRNRTVNSHLKALVDRLGELDAPAVAAFYLTHNKPFYISARHSTNLLLRDCEGLRTEWATGIKSTSLEARSAEMIDAAQEQIKRVGKILERRQHETA